MINRERLTHTIMAIFKDGLTVDETTGKVLAVGDKTADYNTTSTVTPTLTLSEAQKQAGEALGANSGLVSPMSLADIRAKEAEKATTAKTGAEAQFAPQIQQAQVSGARNVAAAEGTLAGGGVGAGTGIGSAQVAFLAATQTDVQNRIKTIEDQKAAAISAGNLEASNWADTQLQKLNEYNNNLLLKKADLAMNLISQNQAQQQIDISKTQNEATQKLQAEQLALQSYETALKTPVGQSFTVNGITYEGLEDISGIDPANITVSTDDKGYETGIDKTTGKVLWKSKTPTGKTKTQAANVTVNIPSYQVAPYYVNGQQAGTVRYDTKSGKNVVQTNSGSTIPVLPQGATVGTFSAGNPSTDTMSSLIQSLSQ